MAYEAADTGLLSPELVAGNRRVKVYHKLGRRVGNWLSPQSANSSPWEPLLKHFRQKRDGRDRLSSP